MDRVTAIERAALPKRVVHSESDFGALRESLAEVCGDHFPRADHESESRRPIRQRRTCRGDLPSELTPRADGQISEALFWEAGSCPPARSRSTTWIT